jgi:hypothetical protein
MVVVALRGPRIRAPPNVIATLIRRHLKRPPGAASGLNTKLDEQRDNLHAHLSASRKYPMEPYHGWFSGSPTFGSIRLLPVETPLAERAVENTLVGHQATTPPEAEVLVRVNLHDTPVGPHDLEEWKAWLTANVPGSVGHLSVVMAEPSNSRLLILRVSMPLWDFLPDSNAYIFCGRVIPGEGKKPMS